MCSIPGVHTQNFPSSLHQHHNNRHFNAFSLLFRWGDYGRNMFGVTREDSYTDCTWNAGLSIAKQMWLWGSRVMKDVTVSQPGSGARQPPFVLCQPQEGPFLSATDRRCSRLCIEATWEVFCNQDTSFLLMEGPQTSLRTWWCGNKRHYQLEVGLDWGSRIRRAWRGNQRQSHVVKRPPGESAEQEFSKGWTCGSEFLMKATVQVSGKPQGCGYWLGHFAVFKSCFSHLIF